MPNDWIILSELKLDISEEPKTKEACTSHSEQIRAKLNRSKSDNSKVVASTTIESFFKQKTQPIDEHLNNHSSIEGLHENKLSVSPLKCIESIKVNDTQKTFFESKQENVNDEVVETVIHSSNGKNTELTEHDDTNDMNIALTDISVDDSSLENITDQHCLNVPKKLNNEDSKISLINDENVYNYCKNICIKDTKTDCDSSKIKTNISIEVDASIAPKDRKCVIVETSIELIKHKLKSLTCQGSEKQKMRTRFYATIDPNKNQQAESELSREISKDMFSRVSRISKYDIFSKYNIFIFSHRWE